MNYEFVLSVQFLAMEKKSLKSYGLKHARTTLIYCIAYRATKASRGVEVAAMQRLGGEAFIH